MDSGRLQPALVGGLFIGVLSALPIVNTANCCCCLWVISGGVLAAYLRQQSSPVRDHVGRGRLHGFPGRTYRRGPRRHSLHPD